MIMVKKTIPVSWPKVLVETLNEQAFCTIWLKETKSYKKGENNKCESHVPSSSSSTAPPPKHHSTKTL